MPGGINPSTFPLEPLLKAVDEEAPESEEDEFHQYSHNEDLREPPASSWIHTGPPGKKRDFQRNAAKKWLSLRVGNIILLSLLLLALTYLLLITGQAFGLKAHITSFPQEALKYKIQAINWPANVPALGVPMPKGSWNTQLLSSQELKALWRAIMPDKADDGLKFEKWSKGTLAHESPWFYLLKYVTYFSGHGSRQRGRRIRRGPSVDNERL